MAKSKKKIPDTQGKNKEQKVGYKNPPKETRWKPGQSGNPKGRPKSFDALRDLFQSIAEQEVDIGGKKYTRAEAIGIAMSMDKKLMREFLEFAYGKVPQAVTLEGGDTPLTFRIVHDDIARNEDPSAKAVPPEADGSDQQ
jgi:hypothetical protein